MMPTEVVNNLWYAVLEQACEDYGVAVRAYRRGVTKISDSYPVAPQVALKELEAFFHDRFDDINTFAVDDLCRFISKQKMYRRKVN